MKDALLILTAILLTQPTVLESTIRAQTPSVAESPKPTPTQTAELDEATRLSKQVVGLYKERKYDEALPLAKHVVEIRQRILGEYDGRTAAALINLAELYLIKREYSEAQTLYERLLPIYERVFGKDHINNALIVESLALINYLRGNFKQAEEFYLRSLSIKERAFGEDHPDVGHAAYMLAEFYRSRRDYKKAEPLFLRAIAIEDKNPSSRNGEEPSMVERYMCFLYESKGIEEAQKLEAQFSRVRNSARAAETSGEVLNGKAISLPAPGYPPEASRVRAGGVVIVRVKIDETGKVIEAKALCGHPVLAKPSLSAALAARFTPTKLSGKPVQVNGIIIYNFVPR